MSHDQVHINQLELEMSVGAYEWEKHIKQSIFVDVTLFCDSKRAGGSDQLADAVDYAKIADTIQALSLERHYQLIESLAETIAERILDQGAVNRIRINVTKPGAIESAKSVGVTIERSI
jgi:dihydroneopterin aldolase